MSLLFLLIIVALVCWLFASLKIAEPKNLNWWCAGWFCLLLWWAIGEYVKHH